MAAATSFKQECPSCEAMVPIRDEKLIGKQIECPTCKDKFIVVRPALKDESDPDLQALDGAGLPQAKAKKKKKKKGGALDDALSAAGGGLGDHAVEEMDVEEVDDAALQALIAKRGKKVAGSDAKKKTGLSKFNVGVALAAVGLVVLGGAAYIILSSRGPSNTGPIVKGKQPVVPPEEEKKDKEDPKKPPPKRKVDVQLFGAGSELTNLLPGHADYVLHVNLGDLLDPNSHLRDAAFATEGGLQEKSLKQQLGFNPLSVDDLLRAEGYQGEPWSFTVLHLTEGVDREALTTTLALQPEPNIRLHEYYKATAGNAYFDTLARLTVGVPAAARSLTKFSSQRPMYVHFHNPQTLVFADQAPMMSFLAANKQLMYGTKPPPIPPPADSKAKDFDPGPTPVVFSKSETYMTINPALKAMLDRMEARGNDAVDKVLFSSAVNLNAARVPGKGTAPWLPRQLWDLTHLLDRPLRMQALATGLIQKETRVFQLRQEVSCPQEADAKDLQRWLAEHGGPRLARFFERLLGHKVEVPKAEQAPEKAGMEAA